jgi:hypothetical protein
LCTCSKPKGHQTLLCLKMLYFAMIHSHILYCLCIYSCANTTSLNTLRIKQKVAVRVIANAGYRAHTAENSAR